MDSEYVDDEGFRSTSLTPGAGLLVAVDSGWIGDYPNFLDPETAATSLRRVVLESEEPRHNLDGSWDAITPAGSAIKTSTVTQRLIRRNCVNKAGQYGVGPVSFSGSDESDGDLCGALPIAAELISIMPTSVSLGSEQGPTLGGQLGSAGLQTMA
jgi:hypothetical protein